MAYDTIDISGHTQASPVITIQLDGSDLILKDEDSATDYDLAEGYRHIYVEGDNFHIETNPGTTEPSNTTYTKVELTLELNHDNHFHLVKEFCQSGYKLNGGAFEVADDVKFTAIIGTDDLRYSIVDGDKADEILLHIFNLVDAENAGADNDFRVIFDGSDTITFYFKKRPSDINAGPVTSAPIKNQLYSLHRYRTA